MSGLYVASNVGAIGAQVSLSRTNAALSETLTRLTTGLRINSGKDDPAGLIASELLKSDISATQQAIKNTQRANSVIAVADSALGQVGSILNDIRVLVNEGANEGAMSSDQVAANQLQIDASIDSIDRIARTTVFQGKKLLDGSLDFRTTGTDSGALSNVQIQSANFGNASELSVKVRVLEQAKTATLMYYGTGVAQDTVLEIGGSIGSEIFKFGAGTTNADMAAAINAVTESTGVTAHVEGLASRGVMTLGSVGAGNDVVITANNEGFAAGNYTFRVVQGEANDAYVVSDPTSAKPGVVEISLEASNESNFRNFGGMFDVTINTGDAASIPTSVSMTRGNINSAVYSEKDRNASATSADGKKTMNVNAIDKANGAAMSNLNGWTIVADNSVTVGDATKIDMDAKTIRLNAVDMLTGDTASPPTGALQTAIAAITGGNALDSTATNSTVGVAITGVVQNGDKFSLAGGSSAGELFVTYKAGATAGEILDKINGVANVSASLVSGVSAEGVIENVLKAPTRVVNSATTQSRFVADYTAADLVDLLNQKLGHLFQSELKTGDLGTGKVTFQDAAVDYGDVNLDNALRFTGMDSGPITRLVTNGFNQSLSVSLINPSEADIASGVQTQILQINLATDAAGHSISTAKDIVDLFNSLSPTQTGGINASLILPDGVDPNGRTWATDPCGDTFVVENCDANYGLGIVQPTGVAGPCNVTENDLILLGNNQAIYDTAAIARVQNAAPMYYTGAPIDGSGIGFTADGKDVLAFGLEANSGSLLNGVTVVLQSDTTVADDASIVSFDSSTGMLTYRVGAGTAQANLEAALQAATLSDGVSTTESIVSAIKTFNGSKSTMTDLAGVTINAPTDNLINSLGPNGIIIKMGGGFSVGDVIESRATVTAGTAVYAGNAVDGVLSATDSTGAALTLSGGGSDIGSLLDGITVVFKTDSGVAATNTVASFDSASGTLTFNINPAEADATAVSKAIQSATNATNLVTAIKAYNGSMSAATDFSKLALTGTMGGTADVAFATPTTFVQTTDGLSEGEMDTSAAAVTAGSVVSITTDQTTSALNGVSFSFTTDSSQAGFNKTTGALTVFLDPVTQALPAGADLSRELSQAINGSISANWEGIREFTKTTEPGATVTVNSTDVSVAGLLTTFPTTDSAFGSALKFASSTSTKGAAATGASTKGVSVTDPAILIEARRLGTQMAGTKITLIQDTNLQASTATNAYINVKYDQDNGVLEIYANTVALQSGTNGGLNANVLASALNSNDVFKEYFMATAPSNSIAPTTSTNATVAFSADLTVDATMIGGYGIQTDTNLINPQAATSSGNSMVGNVDENQRLVLMATDSGSANFVNIRTISGSFRTFCPLGLEMSYLAGTDVVATVNGQKATGQGGHITISSSNLQMTATIDGNLLDGDETSFTINGGGATFQLGPDVVSTQQYTMGIQSMNSATLGGTSGKLYQLKSGENASLTNSTNLADRIVQEAISSVANIRGRLGAIQRSTFEPNIAVLQDTVEQLSAAEAAISNTDFAAESSNLARLQVLIQSGAKALGIVNQNPQYAAMLIG